MGLYSIITWSKRNDLAWKSDQSVPMAVARMAAAVRPAFHRIFGKMQWSIKTVKCGLIGDPSASGSSMNWSKWATINKHWFRTSGSRSGFITIRKISTMSLRKYRLDVPTKLLASVSHRLLSLSDLLAWWMFRTETDLDYFAANRMRIVSIRRTTEKQTLRTWHDMTVLRR